MTKSSSDKYTDPELRDKIKDEIQAGDKGGEPGQWSARKAQMMAKEYKAQGGGYTDDKKDDTQKHLDKWTEEDWQTKEGDGDAKQEDGMHRYLPKRAWEQMTKEEKEETEKRKLEGSRAGDQYVPNTPKAKKARKNVSDDGASGGEGDSKEPSEEQESEPEAEESEGEEEAEAEGSDEAEFQDDDEPVDSNDDSGDEYVGGDEEDDEEQPQKASISKSGRQTRSAPKSQAKASTRGSKQSKQQKSRKQDDNDEDDEDEPQLDDDNESDDDSGENESED